MANGNLSVECSWPVRPDRGAENAGKLAILLDEAGKPGISNDT
jgi:hypothetical protein